MANFVGNLEVISKFNVKIIIGKDGILVKFPIPLLGNVVCKVVELDKDFIYLVISSGSFLLDFFTNSEKALSLVLNHLKNYNIHGEVVKKGKIKIPTNDILNYLPEGYVQGFTGKLTIDYS